MALIPEDAPGWAIRLEAKLDIAIAQYGQTIEHQAREIETLRRDHERDAARLELADKGLDERVDVLERSSFVTTKGMWTAVAGSVAVVGTVATLISQISNLF